MGCGASSALSHPQKRGKVEHHELDTLTEENSESKRDKNAICAVNANVEHKDNALHTSQSETVLTLSSNELLPTAIPRPEENSSNVNNNNNNNNNSNNDNNARVNTINDGNSNVTDGTQFEPSSMSSFDRVQPLQTQSSNGKSDSVSSKKEISFEEALAIVTQQLTQRQREGVSKVTKEEAERVVLMARELDNLKQMMRRSKYTVVGTWSIVENENMLGRFAQQLYDELLTANPRLRVYFYGVDLEEQSQTLLRMLSTAVRLYDKPQAMVDMLTKAGGRHRGYGVTKDTFVEMQNAFMKVFPKFIGEDVFSAAEDEWRKFWKLMLDLLEHGSVTSEGERYGKMYEEQNTKKLQNDFKLIVERQNKCDLRHQFVGIMYAKAIEMYGDLSKFDALKDLRASTRVFQAYVKIIKNLNDRE